MHVSLREGTCDGGEVICRARVCGVLIRRVPMKRSGSMNTKDDDRDELMVYQTRAMPGESHLAKSKGPKGDDAGA